MRLRLAAGLLILLIALPASASTWVSIGKTKPGSSYDIDSDSIHRDGNLVTFTVRAQYAPAIAETGADGFTAIRQANCADRTYVDIHTDYMKTGKVLNSTTKEETHAVKPGTIGARVLDKACSK
jgi:hypothetical protein